MIGAVQAFAIPGHTPGSAAYLVDGVLFLGARASASAGSGGALEAASLEALAERLRPREAEAEVLVPAQAGVLRGLAPLLAFEGR